MQITLTDQRVKALAKALRKRLPHDPGHRAMLDALAGALGYGDQYGALKTAIDADAKQPADEDVPDAASDILIKPDHGP